jgi:hypothetical protein
MRRRVWPILLAFAAILVFASYLYYTQILVREIREQAAMTSRIYFLVQRGRLSSTSNSGEAELSLFDIMDALQDRDVPMVYFNAPGDVGAAVNLPFEADLDSPEGIRAVAEFAARLENRNPENKVVVQGVGSVYFGEPALLSTLRWVPWLQAGAGAVLVLVAIAFLRADLRAEREKLWAAMARELAHQMGTPLSSLADCPESSVSVSGRAGSGTIIFDESVTSDDAEATVSHGKSLASYDLASGTMTADQPEHFAWRNTFDSNVHAGG